MQFYLVHGGFGGSWCWREVAAELSNRGHLAAAPTLTDLARKTREDSRTGLSDLITSVVWDIADRGMNDLIVVGHSGGGPVIQGVAEAIPERIRMLIFMSGSVLHDGESILDLQDEKKRLHLEREANASSSKEIRISDEAWINHLCADMSREQASSFLPELAPCPLGWISEAARLPGNAWRKLPAGYIFLECENSSEQSLYERMAARLVDPIIAHCPGAHQAMLSQPSAVAATLLDIAERSPARSDAQSSLDDNRSGENTAGKGRLLLSDVGLTSEPNKAVLQRLSVPAAKALNIHRALAFTPPLFGGFTELAMAIKQVGDLSPQDIELAILLTAHLRDGRYQIARHMKLARKAGIPEDQLIHLQSWRRCHSFDPRQRALLELIEQSLGNSGVSKRAYKNAKAFFTDRQLVELIMISGFAACSCQLTNTFQIPIDAPA